MVNIDWIGYSLASVAVVLAPGPGSMFVAKTAASAGPRAGRMAMLGIMTGDACLIGLSLIGVSALFHAHPALFKFIRLIGAGYLIYLGLQSVFTRPETRPDGRAESALPFRRAVSITLLNPKAVFFFMAFFPVFIRSAEGGLVLPYAVMTQVFMAISATYLSFLIRASSRVALAFQENKMLQSAARKLCGCVFIGFGLKVAAASK
ncbi:MAG: LysE family transporter [Nitrospiraceae bacterium]|nr:LysE family transporter [Nitrospiraceae bacterium]